MLRSVRQAVLSVAGLAWLAVAASVARADVIPPGTVVAEVIVRGNRRVSAEQVLAPMETRVGRPFNLGTLQNDVSKLLSSRGYRTVEPRYLLENNRLVIYIDVQEQSGVVEKVEYQGGGHLKLDDLAALTGVREGQPMNPDANRAACHAIARKYQEQGRLFASVRLVEGGQPGDRKVIFAITEGPVVKLGSIAFDGNSFVSGERLRTQITCSSGMLRMGVFGNSLNGLQIEQDVAKLEEYYRALGFHEVSVKSEPVLTSDHTVKLVFHVHEGPRYRIGKVEIVGNRSFTTEELRRITSVKPGEWSDGRKTQTDVLAMKTYIGNRGYPVGIQPVVYQTGTPGEVDLHYEVQERPPLYVGQIIVVGNTVTRNNVILRNLDLYPGQILQIPSIDASVANLNRLGIFATEEGDRPAVTILDEAGDNPYKDILVQVKEAPTGSFMLGLGVNSNSGLSGSIVLNERNFDLFRPPTSLDDFMNGTAFRGAGQEFRLEAVPGNRVQRYTASFREPSLFDSPYSLATSGFYYQRGFIEYFEERTGGRVTVARNFANYWSANVSSRVENVNVSDISQFATPDISSAYGNNLLVGLGVGAKRDTRDSYLRPTAGGVLEGKVEQVFGDFNYQVGTIEASRFFTTWQRPDGSGRHVLAFKSQAAFTGDDTPVFERFYAGGFQSIRGFGFRGVGPFVNDLNVGGQMMLLNSVEYQVPVLASDAFYLVGFVDSGTVERKFDLKDYRVSAGVGVRMQIPMLGPVPIALDFGFPIVKGPGDREQIFAFWLGFFN